MPIPPDRVRPVPFDFGVPFGAQYYRAPTPPPEDWARDLDQLKAHGMNVIKIWGQWRWNHPDVHEFWFDDLDGLMDLAADRDLRVVINVIFDVMPSWLLEKHPDCRMIRCDGRPVGPTALAHRQIGGAPGPCLNHRDARTHRERFLRTIVERYRDHPALWIWGLWNEPELTCGMVRGGQAEQQVCWCDSCRQAFIRWLRMRHGSLEVLNRRWARNYTHWENIELPGELTVSADWVDWRLFFRDTLTGEMRWRAEQTRELDETHPVMCHTVPPPIFNIACCGSDDFQLAREGDLFGNTCSGMMPIMTDVTRSAADGRPLLAGEIHAVPGMTLHRPTPLSRAALEKHVFGPLFGGVKGFLFWQYRAERLGKEAPAWGMTKLDGSPERWLAECREVSAVLQEHADFILKSEPEPAPVGVIMVPENEIFLYAHDGSLDRYWAGVVGAYELLRDLGHRVDFVHSSQLLNCKARKYAALVAPVPYAYPWPVVQAVSDYVEHGGRLLAEGFAGAHDPETGMASTLNPGMGLDEVFGCVEESVVPSARVDVRASYGAGGLADSDKPRFSLSQAIAGLPEGTRIEGRLAEQRLRLTTGRSLASFADGSAAVVEHDFGDGSATLIGCWVFQAYREDRPAELRRLVAGLLPLPPAYASSEQARVERLVGEGRSWLMIENPSAEERIARVDLAAPPKSVRDIRSGEDVAVEDGGFEVALRADGLCVVEVEE